MDTDAVRPRWRANVAYRATPRLSVGLEANLAANELVPNANWIALVETPKLPMVSFGTSSDRIFTPDGYQAYYATIAKTIPGSAASAYVSVNYSEFDRGINFPFGLNVALTPDWDFLGMYDSERTHLLLTRKFARSNVTLIVVDLNQPRFGISYGIGF